MSIKIRIFLLLVLFIFCVAIVNASSFYSVEGYSLEACSCNIFSNPIILQNTGEIDAIFHISQEGSAASWSALSHSSIILKAGEKKELLNILNIPCNIQGDYTLKTKIISYDSEEEIIQKIAVERCPNFKVVGGVLEKEACTCTPFVYDIWLTNKGSFEDKFQLELTRFSESATFPENPVSLEPEQTKQVYIYITPTCDISGNYASTLKITSEKGGFYAEAPIKLDIKDCSLEGGEITNTTSTPKEVGSSLKVMLILLVSLIFLMIVMYVVYQSASRDEKAYYARVKIKDPKLKTKKKQTIEEFSEKIRSKFWTRVLLIIAVVICLLLFMFLSYKIFAMFPAAVPVGVMNETQQNETIQVEQQVEEIIQEETTPENTTIDEQVNQTEETSDLDNETEKVSVTDKVKSTFSSGFSKTIDFSKKIILSTKNFLLMYLWYFVAGIAILVLIIIALTLTRKK